MIKDVKYAKYYMDNELDGKIIKIDKGFTAITGYTWEDVQANNMTISDLVPEESREEYLEILQNSVEAGEAYLNHAIACKDGSVIAVNCYGEVYMDSDSGHGCSKVLIIDVTAQEKAVEELSILEEQAALQFEKIKFLTENARETFLDYDIQKDYLEISRFVNGRYEVVYSLENYMNSDNRHMYDEDLQHYRSVLGKNNDAMSRSVFDFRSKLFSEGYRWYRLVYARYDNPKTGKTHVIGRIMDINEEKIASLNSEVDSQFDPLTGVYNAVTTEIKVNEIFQNTTMKTKHTMLVIDIDHMRAINGRYGVEKGDKVLSEVANMLCQVFRQNFDIIGRVYADIFVVFIRNTVEINYIEERCKGICNKVRTDISKDLLGEEGILTVSIGIGPSDGKSSAFKSLYKKTDKALQRQKDNGRDGFGF